jgi:hypothetical protein
MITKQDDCLSTNLTASLTCCCKFVTYSFPTDENFLFQGNPHLKFLCGAVNLKQKQESFTFLKFNTCYWLGVIEIEYEMKENIKLRTQQQDFQCISVASIIIRIILQD